MKERANSGLHSFLFSYLTKKGLASPESIMDVAAGTGAWLHRFKETHDERKLGLDIDITQFCLSGIEVRQLNIDQYNGQLLGSFELITCIELIEHLENPGNLIALIKKNLSKSGVCLISTPNIHGIHARLRFLLKGRLGHFDNKSDPTHIYPVYVENFERIVHNHGLKIIETSTLPQTDNYSLPIKFLACVLKYLLPNQYSGDNIIFVLKHLR